MSNSKISTLMIVDDSEVDQMLCKRLIERSNLVDTVLNYLYAEQALEHLKNNQTPMPDVILLDINMPRMNGFEFLEAVSRLPVNVQKPIVVMLTTSHDSTDEYRASQFDLVKGYLPKPLSLESLQSIVKYSELGRDKD